MGNDNKNSRPTDIDIKRPATLNETLRNELPNELSRNFKEVTFSKSEFLFGIPVLDIRYMRPRS